MKGRGKAEHQEADNRETYPVVTRHEDGIAPRRLQQAGPIVKRQDGFCLVFGPENIGPAVEP